MLADCLREGMDSLLFSMRPTLLICAGLVCLEWGRGKKITIKASMVWTFLWLSWLITILHAERIVGARADWLSAGACFRIMPYRGNPPRMLFNALLFVPYGFLTPFALKKSGRGLRGAAMLGTFTSAAIAASRLAFGRDAAIADVMLGTTGTMIGYLLALFLAVPARRACLKKRGVPIDSAST